MVPDAAAFSSSPMALSGGRGTAAARGGRSRGGRAAFRKIQQQQLLLVVLAVLLLLLSGSGVLVNAEFNYEVEKRVLERIHDYMNGPRIANGITARYRTNGGFEYNMDARSRDSYLKFAYSLMQEYKFDMLYFGLEDGTFLGYGVGWGTYREPRNSGYDVTDSSMRHYYKACVDRETGVDRNCTMSTGNKYIQCIRNCGLMKCADEETQECSNAIGSGGGLGVGNDNNSGTDVSHCLTQKDSIKWCRQYDILEATDDTSLGYVPRTYYCHDEKGVFTQQPGHAVKRGFLEPMYSDKIKLGDCEYENKKTKVERFEVGPYAYCNNSKNKNYLLCDNTFDGGYRSRDYDPRYRSWYIQTKSMQVPNWSPPYPFFSNLDLGITYSHPIYSLDEQDRYVFEGVLACDYTFEDIGNFLVDGYKDSKTKVVVYEQEEPNYIVASSTGRKAASKVLAEFPDQPCPDDSNGDNCIVVRDSMNDLQGYEFDELLVRSYEEQRDQNYPRELLTVKGSQNGNGNDNDELYVVQSSFYKGDGGLNWIVLVISPAGEGEADAITPDNPLFGMVCVVASVGFCLCFAMFYSFYQKRNERAVILADWRFTSAFLLGCAFLNLSTFTLLGENTDATCMLRMWSFHFLFALALSPLFVKVWRMWRMVGTPNRQPAIVNHSAAAMLSLPIVAVQVLILTIFSFADPPKQEEIIDIEDGIVTQRIVCTQETRAFMIVMMTYESGLVVCGCVLAYLTRNMDSQFGEAKQLMFSMYNIAFIGLITTVIIYAMDIDATGQIMLSAIGIFWGTFFSSAVFVLPRLLRAKEERKRVSSGIMKKSQAKRATTAVAVRGSKVRFSVDEESSVHSEPKKSIQPADDQPLDKNLNPSNGGIPMTKQEIVGRASVDSKTSNGMDDSFFVRSTGWSVFEVSEQNAMLGRWSANEKSDEFQDEGMRSTPGGGDDQENTARTASDDDSPTMRAMSTIEELEDLSDSEFMSQSHTSRHSISGHVSPPTVDEPSPEFIRSYTR